MSPSPDWVRIGPPYGQINELARPFVNTGALASADAVRYGARGWWAADNWGPVPSGPGSAIASWSITASAGSQTMDASGFYNVMSVASDSRQWQIYNATTMPPSMIVAAATVALPYTATGMMVFELVGGATFAAFPVVPEFATRDAPQFVLATANGSVIGSAVPANGSAAIFEMSRSYLHMPVPTQALYANDEAQFASYRYVGLQIRTVGSVASGAMLRIQSMRLSVLPVPWIGTSAGPLASAALAQASALVGTWYSQSFGGIHLGQWGISRLARYPAVATIDGQQPNGAAVEIGSTIVAGQAQWGSDLVQKNYAQSLLTPGDPLAFERIPNRNITFPYVSRSPSMNSHLFQREIEWAIKPGNVVDVIPEDAQNAGGASGYYRRFDLVDGRVVNNEDIRYQRAGIARGEIQLQTQPYPRAASYIKTTVVGSAGMPGLIYQPGDVPAPAYFVYQGAGAATGQSAGVAAASLNVAGFVAGFVPSMATFNPLGTQGGVGLLASMLNGYKQAGSQAIFGVNASGGADVTIAQGWMTNGFQETLGGRVRVFVVAGNASTGTVAMRLQIQAGPGNTMASVVSNIGYLRPLAAAVASEVRQLSLVDLGELRLPMDQIAMTPSIGWNLYALAGASLNATVGVFDTVLFFPVGDPKGWFGAVPAGAASSMYIIHASGALQSIDLGNTSGQPGGGQAALIYRMRYGAVDVTAQYQGRSPYLSPGITWSWTIPLAGASRPYTQGSSGLQNVNVYSYPRFLFLQ